MPRDLNFHDFTDPDAAQGIIKFRRGQRLFNRRYEMIRPLGAGGMGVVWLARDTVEGCECALKFLPSLIVHQEKEMDRLRAEVRTGKGLRHPGLVATYAMEADDSVAAIVMEYVEGETLRQKLDANPRGFFEPHEIEGWVRDIADGLTYLHDDAKRVHRDLKPANVIVGPDNRARLMDFGISHRLKETLSRHSKIASEADVGGSSSSSLAYASPQQLSGKPATAADDIYGFGALIYELLTGSPPFFRGDAAVVTHQINSVPVPPLMERRQELVADGMYADAGAPVPAGWEHLVQRCLAKERADRCPSASAVLAERNAKLNFAPPAQATPTQASDKKDSTGGAKCNFALRPAPRSRVPLVLTIVVLAAGAGGWAIWKNREPAPDPASGASKHQAAEEAEKARQAQELAAAKEKADAAEKTSAKLRKEKEAMEATQREEASRKAAEQKRMAEEAARAIPTPATATKEKPFVNSLGMKFVPVPGTEVLFCIHETRSKDFAAFIADKNRGYTMSGSNADDWKSSELEGVPVGRGATGLEADVTTSTHPVATISWLDASAFCDWLSKKDGKSYRLPTDREWSVAVGIPQEPAGTPQELGKATVADFYPWGGKFVASAISGNYADLTAKEKGTDYGGTIAGYRDGFATTAPVMSFTGNSHGLYDMGGNLWEWVAGCFDGTDPLGKNRTLTSYRALRGGSWNLEDPALLLSSLRYNFAPGYRNGTFGFRVVVAGSGG